MSFSSQLIEGRAQEHVEWPKTHGGGYGGGGGGERKHIMAHKLVNITYLGHKQHQMHCLCPFSSQLMEGGAQEHAEQPKIL